MVAYNKPNGDSYDKYIHYVDPLDDDCDDYETKKGYDYDNDNGSGGEGEEGDGDLEAQRNVKSKEKRTKCDRIKQIIMCPFYALWACLCGCAGKCSLFYRDCVWTTAQQWCVCVVGLPTMCAIIVGIIFIIVYSYGIAKVASGLGEFALNTPGKIMTTFVGPSPTSSPTIPP